MLRSRGGRQYAGTGHSGEGQRAIVGLAPQIPPDFTANGDLRSGAECVIMVRENKALQCVLRAFAVVLGLGTLKTAYNLVGYIPLDPR